MKSRAILIVLVALATPALAAADGAGWREESPAAGMCSDGSPWRFYFRPGTSANVAVYFQGGGSCWNARMCDPLAQPTYDATVTSADHPATSHGLLDFNRVDNPIRDWNVLFLPYCTADAHTGNRTAEYRRDDGSTFTVRHHGQANTRAALDWLAARLIAQGVAPPTILLSGESAGAIAAAYWGIEVSDRFQSAQLVVIGDAAGGYRTLAVNTALTQWNALENLPASVPAFAERSAIYFETFYLGVSQRVPGARLAQMNFSDDAVQRQFRDYLSSPVEVLTKDLTCNLNEIRRDAPGFHSYIYPGTEHVMMRTNALYTTACEGHRLVRWVDDILHGRSVENHWCDGSAAPFSNVYVPRL